MYTVSDWSICSAPSWISARMRSHYRIGLERAIGVTSVRMRREDRSSIVVSASRRPRRVKVLATSFDSSLALCCSFVCALRLFLRPGLRMHRRAARRGRQGWPSRLCLRLAATLPGHALMGPSTARGSSRLGRRLIGPDALEGTPVVENRPGDAGEFVGKRNRQHVVVQPLFRRLDPGLEAHSGPTALARA